MLAVTTVTDGLCPACGKSLASVHGAVPWCPHCEHGLALLEPGVPGDIGWSWLDRWAYRRAFRSTMAEFQRLRDGANKQLERGRRHPADLAVTAAAILIYGGVAACLVVGVWLVTWRFPSLALVPGLLLVLIAVELRPRFGRLPRNVAVLRRDETPEIHALVERVAKAVGAPPPQVICVDDQFNAMAGVYGLRRRRVLVLGMPLWQSMAPQQRVALLGHELGHFVNGDPRRGLGLQPVYRNLSTVVALLAPSRPRSGDFGVWLGEKLLGGGYGRLRTVGSGVQNFP